ncbi:hypothetical protein DL764_002690 [Monosporascus ibericus]|uniref:2-isopropylmalate synthase n=1 Tax=Monosporascus ibericus TaxID=155417 RepID=A0A4Q4TP48_9PEZI|nr:hypothetical protein DL764_002690 [Monosporascus ibericus]
MQNGDEKWRYFNILVELGYKEIEVSFPSASQTDFDFTRRIVETPGIVPDLWLQAILHIYLATNESFRRIVFGFSEVESIQRAVACAKYARSITKVDPEQAGTEWASEFSPVAFSDTSPEFAVRICEAVKAAWEPTKENPIIFNLPATAEIVEGCLFGNGERTGNVYLVTFALNLYPQGIHPNIDFSDLDCVIDTVEICNKIPVDPRAPYGGSLVVCAISGSHQDAIKKGFKVREEQSKAYEDEWEIPYLPLDPQDIGRTYEAVIRVNSQSGKGGAAWTILRKLELDHPRGLQIAFSKAVQKKADEFGRELLTAEISDLFEKTYFLRGNPRFTIVDYKEHAIGGRRELKAATYIESTAAGTSQVWDVGIHEDVVQSSPMALLGAASNLRRPTVANGSVTSHAGPSNQGQKLEEKVNGV